VGEPVPGSDHEPLERVGGVERDAGGGVGRTGRLGRGFGADEVDLGVAGVGAGEGGAKELGIAAGDPAADVPRAGQVQRRAALADRPEGREPEAVGRLRDARPELRDDPAPSLLRPVARNIVNPPVNLVLLSPSANLRRVSGAALASPRAIIDTALGTAPGPPRRSLQIAAKT
jgi:hypothetical protein